jgi:hypothetical protein
MEAADAAAHRHGAPRSIRGRSSGLLAVWCLQPSSDPGCPYVTFAPRPLSHADRTLCPVAGYLPPNYSSTTRAMVTTTCQWFQEHPRLRVWRGCYPRFWYARSEGAPASSRVDPAFPW